MELLNGARPRQPELDKRARGPGAPDRRCCARCAGASAAAHEAGIVHRDIKPENIILVTHEGRRDMVKIVDFGMSAMLSGRPRRRPDRRHAGPTWRPSRSSQHRLRRPPRHVLRSAAWPTSCWSASRRSSRRRSRRSSGPADAEPDAAVEAPPGAVAPVALEAVIPRCLEAADARATARHERPRGRALRGPDRRRPAHRLPRARAKLRPRRLRSRSRRPAAAARRLARARSD